MLRFQSLITKLFVAVCAVTLFSAQNASAVVVNHSADADTYIQKGNADKHFGSDNIVLKDSGGGSTTRIGYIRFEKLGSFVAENAALELTVAQRSPGGSGNSATQLDYTIEVFGLNDNVAEQDWVEAATVDGVTGPTPPNPLVWNNAPANNTANNELIGSDVTFLGSFVVPGTSNPGEFFSFQSSAMLDFVRADTDGVLNFIINREGGSGSNNLAFASREHTSLAGPNLALTIIPEPATATLGLIGLAGLAARRRRSA